MIIFSFEVTDPIGFHVRPAGHFIRCALQYESAVTLHCGRRVVNGRHILELLCLRARYGDEVHVVVEGPDEIEAAEALKYYVYTYS